MTALEPLGDRAYLARFATEDEARDWAATVRERRWPGVVDVVLAYDCAAVFADPELIDADRLGLDLRGLRPRRQGRAADRLIRLPVLYDGEDLDEVGRHLGIGSGEVVARHAGQDYRVFAIGFLPGFPYAGYLPPELSGLPRRQEPRVRVPAGSVAIAGRQTGIYPDVSPGGWHLIGRTPLRIVDLPHARFPIRAGDRIRFDPIDAAEFADRRGEFL